MRELEPLKDNNFFLEDFHTPFQHDRYQQLQLVIYYQMQSNEGEEELKFRSSLAEFLKSRQSVERKSPCFNQFHLYKLVCRRGGCQSVTNRKEWAKIADELSVKDSVSVRHYYVKYLYAYERKHYFGTEDEDEEPLFVHMLPRKMAKTEAKEQANKIKDENFSLEEDLAKGIEEELKEREIFYLNKNKLNHSKTENKRIILGLDAFMSRREAIYSLNMLLLYSVNSNIPFLLENNEKIFHAIQNYAHSLYPPQNEEQKEHLRTVIAIFRNLTMNPINLKFILGTPIFSLFVTIFNRRFDPECSKNIVDIMTGLVKVGWDCNEIINEIEEAVLDDRCEDIENSIDLLRGLIDEREENMINNVKDRVDVFIKLLLSTEVSIQLKEQALEILSFVSDVNAEARLIFSKNQPLLGILIGILQNMRNQEKLSQFAALTLSNISTTPGAKYELSFFETELIQIGFTDDSLAGIIANILADVANV